MSKRGKAIRHGGRAKPSSAAAAGGGAPLSRRAWIGVAVGSAAAALLGERWWRTATPSVIAAGATPITVYSSPSCGCCHKWVKHLARNKFHVTVESVSDVTPVKTRFGIPEPLWSCHTAIVDGYAVEGHVPADLIAKMLSERLAIAGIAVPGMPNGSPGMEGLTKDRYEIITFTRAGTTAVYAVR